MSDIETIPDETTDLVRRLRNGCVMHVRRWSGDTHDDLGGTVMEEETDIIMSEAADLIEAQAARAKAAETARDVLWEALDAIKADCRTTHEQYHKNGPQWTSRATGAEYADMSYVLDKATEIEAIADAALARAEGR